MKKQQKSASKIRRADLRVKQRDERHELRMLDLQESRPISVAAVGSSKLASSRRARPPNAGVSPASSRIRASSHSPSPARASVVASLAANTPSPAPVRASQASSRSRATSHSPAPARSRVASHSPATARSDEDGEFADVDSIVLDDFEDDASSEIFAKAMQGLTSFQMASSVFDADTDAAFESAEEDVDDADEEDE
jgi:hypothetical protein